MVSPQGFSATARPRPALHAAIAFLQCGLSSGRWESGERLPSTGHLALDAGVALKTMSRAVHHMQERGSLTAIRGRGIFAGAAPPRVVPASAGPKWMDLQALLRDDILSGRYRHARKLPTLQEMQAQYSVGYRTLKKSLAGLRREGLLEGPDGSARPVVPRIGSKGRQLRLWLEGNMRGIIWPDRFPPLVLRAIRALEEECSRRNLSLDLRGLPVPFKPELVRSRERGLLGSLYWRSSLQGDGLVRWLRMLGHGGHPAAVFDMGRDLSAPALPESFRGLYRLDERGAGRAVGTFLKAHRRNQVAYIDAFPGTQWSRDRLEGLAEGLGQEDEVSRPYALEPGDMQKDFRALLDKLAERAGQPLATLSGQALLQAMAWDLGRKGLPKSTVLTLKRSFHALTWDSVYMAHRLRPLFERALMEGKRTWVGANDLVALHALDFLEERGVSVPGQVAIVGFDDGDMALRRSLTSYAFDMAGMAFQVLERIMGRRSEGRASSVHRVGGRVVPRISTSS